MIKLKDILMESNAKPLLVYHGTGSRFLKFNLNKSTHGIVWFTSDKNKVLNREVGAQGNGYIITAEVSISNPAGWAEYERLGLYELKRDGYDGAILPNESGFDCFVFDPNQIKILKVEKL